MGLLSNTKTRQKFGQLVSRYNNKLSCVCYIAGLIWFVALAYQPFNAENYFSENALLPGLVDSSFHAGEGISNYLAQLKNELSARKNTSDSQRIPSDWLEMSFRQLGLDTYVQNYTFKYPAHIFHNMVHPGQNVYAILRAPRIASTEAIVISAPFRPTASTLDRTNAGIALMLQLAKSFRRHTYWAKDIIFLVTEHEQIGMQAWLSAYHYTNNEYVLPGELRGRAGSIQAALNLELAHESFSRINVKVEGLNGQLPNLDLVHTVTRLCRKVGIPPTQQRRLDHRLPETWDGFYHCLQTMLRMVWTQLGGSGSGNHALFHQHNIEAVTVQSVRLRNAQHQLQQAGIVVEGVVRSLNNLLERFHQSFFFYLLPSTSRYISIGLYMPPVAMLILPLLIKAIALWIELQANATEDSKESRPEDEKLKSKGTGPEHQEAKSKESGSEHQEAKSKGTGPEQQEEKSKGSGSEHQEEKIKGSGPEQQEEKIKGTRPEQQEEKSKGSGPEHQEERSKGSGREHQEEKSKTARASLLTIGPWFTVAMVSAYIAHHAPVFCIRAAHWFHVAPSSGLALGAAILHVIGAITPWMLFRRGGVETDWRLLKCATLLAISLVLAGVATINISLAFVLASVATPVAFIVRHTEYRALQWLQFILLLLVSPLCILLATSAGDLLIHSQDVTPTSVWQATEGNMLLALINSYTFGNWTLNILSFTVFPAWIMLISILYPSCFNSG